LTLPKDGVGSLYYLMQGFYYEALLSLSSVIGLENKKYFSARVIHCEKKIESIWQKRYYGDRLIYQTSNIAKREVLKDQSDLDESKKIVQKIKEFQDSGDSLFNKIEVEREPESCLTDGICFGICLDVAGKFLDDKDVHEVMKEYQKGGPKEAAANQAVYQLMTYQFTYDKDLQHMVEQIMLSGAFESIDQDGILYAFAKHLEVKSYFEMPREALLAKNPYATDRNKILPTRFNTLFIEHSERDMSLTETEKLLYDSLVQYSEGLIAKAKADRKASEAEFSGSKNSLWNALIKFTQKLFGKPKDRSPQELIFQGIEDEVMRYQMREIRRNMVYVNKQKVMMQYRGCRLGDVSNIFGLPGTYTKDEDVLENARQLEAGVYEIRIGTKSGGHVILLKVEEDSHAYILDPNIGMFHSKSSKETYGLLLEIVKSYSAPKNTHPHGKKGDVNHQLSFYKVEKAKKETVI